MSNGIDKNPDSKVYGANMGPTWALSAPDGLHVGPMNLASREMLGAKISWARAPDLTVCIPARYRWTRGSHVSVLLALCVGNSAVTGDFPSKRPVTLTGGKHDVTVIIDPGNNCLSPVRCQCAYMWPGGLGYFVISMLKAMLVNNTFSNFASDWQSAQRPANKKNLC